MGYQINELFNQMNNLGLTFRRGVSGELEVAGNTALLTDAIKQAIAEHHGTILACTPELPANAIRQQLDEFALWLRQFAWWAQQRYLDCIDQRLAEAVDTQNQQTVAQQIESLRQEIDGINWAAEILPRAYEAEAKHAIAAGAGPAEDPEDGGGLPF